VDVVITDRPGLFEKITGALAVTGLNILGARAVTRQDDLAIDVFYVEGENGGIVEDPAIREFFENTLTSFISDQDCPEQQISAHRKKKEKSKTFSTSDKFGATIPPQVDVYRDISLGRTIVEVRAADRIGLLHLLSKHIADAGFSILFARIATEQGIATDIFNIEPLDRRSVPEPRAFLDLREKLGEALHEGKYYHEV
jgi:[protein-PII] uridylyltransferase